MTNMPREAPDRVGDVSRSSSLPASSNGLVVSRSVVRKPPRRAQSGERLAEMKAMYRGAANSPGSLTPRNNRQRIVARAVLEMSGGGGGGDIDLISDAEDDATINSNMSSGSISLSSPAGNGTMPLRGDSPTDRTEGSSSHRRRTSSQSRKNSMRQRKPNSMRTINRDRNEGEKEMDRSTRSERRSRTSGSSGSSSSRNRSQSRKRNSRSGDRNSSDKARTRSSSLHEKRNARGPRSSAPSRGASTSQAPNTGGNLNRATVTEDEIMDLLTLDYEMPLTALSPTSKNQKATRRSSREKNPAGQRRISSSMHAENNVNRRSSSRSPVRPESSARSISSESEKLNGSHQSLGSIGESRGIDRSKSSETPRSSSRRRIAPRRTQSDDSPALDNFLSRNDPRDRRTKPSSGSRSVASMPAKAQNRRQRQHRGTVGRRNSDRTDDTDSSSKPSSLASLEQESDTSGYMDRMGASGTIHYHDYDESASQDDHSIDLDLATARTTFTQQNLNEKLQMHLSKTDELLYSVFPKHVADSLRIGKKVEPENHDLVTIFFSDIIGFTDISSSLDPMKISDMLDRLYHSFDALSDYHDVFKVETIGDAYMAVTNLAKKQPDHCKRISEFAIDAIRVANQTLIDEENPDLGFVNIRVGFHSGPVVSNVVGTRNPRYCLFGDTVNTASRMESNSQENRIHCSEASARLLRQQCPKIRIFPRGAIEVKGKGEMKTYWIHTEGSNSSNNVSSKKTVVRDGVKNVLKSLRGERGRKVSA